jgi:TonB family protein
VYPPDKHPPDKRPPDNDPIWKANPGGEFLFPSGGKPLAGTPVKFASKVDVVAGKKTQAGRSRADRSPLLADVAANVAVPHEVPNSQIGSHTDSHSTDSPSDDTTSAESPPILAGAASQSASDEVLSAKASLPGLSAPVSRKVSGGQLVHRVEPVYPAQALLSRLEGKVILAAMVMEDGTVSDVKIVEGSPDLAPAAVDAVKHWRYKPFELDGKPVKSEIAISVEFKLPSAASR